MNFHFSLSAVLEFRKALEQRESLALEKLQHQIARLELRLRDLDEQLRAVFNRREGDLKRGLPAIHLQCNLDQEALLNGEKKRLRAELERTLTQKVERLKLYTLARQKREVLESLRDRQLQEFNRIQEKRHQAVMDDLFLARRKDK